MTEQYCTHLLRWMMYNTMRANVCIPSLRYDSEKHNYYIDRSQLLQQMPRMRECYAITGCLKSWRRRLGAGLDSTEHPNNPLNKDSRHAPMQPSALTLHTLPQKKYIPTSALCFTSGSPKHYFPWRLRFLISIRHAPIVAGVIARCQPT